jgi:hypothetical protein
MYCGSSDRGCLSYPFYTEKGIQCSKIDTLLNDKIGKRYKKFSASMKMARK